MHYYLGETVAVKKEIEDGYYFGKITKIVKKDHHFVNFFEISTENKTSHIFSAFIYKIGTHGVITKSNKNYKTFKEIFLQEIEKSDNPNNKILLKRFNDK